jgi:hypothetical protein
VLAGLLFFPRGPQVQVVLRQLSQYFPPPLVQEVFELAGGQPGGGGAGELGGQCAEHVPGDRERVIKGTAQYASMRVLLP